MGDKEQGTTLVKNADALSFPVAGSAQTYDSTSFCPGSASTATSLSTGHKTYSGTINMDESGTVKYETISEKLRDQLGYRIGVISSVNLSHATPAAFFCHQPSHSKYYEIDLEMIASKILQTLVGSFALVTVAPFTALVGGFVLTRRRRTGEHRL